MTKELPCPPAISTIDVGRISIVFFVACGSKLVWFRWTGCLFLGGALLAIRRAGVGGLNTATTMIRRKSYGLVRVMGGSRALIWSSATAGHYRYNLEPHGRIVGLPKFYRLHCLQGGYLSLRNVCTLICASRHQGAVIKPRFY